MKIKAMIGIAAATAIASGAASATLVTAGSNTFNDGWAAEIIYDDAANRGTSLNRDEPLNALGSDTSTFFEIGLLSSVDLRFGTEFTSPGTLIEVTNGVVANWPESVEIFVGNQGGTFTSIGTMSNAAAQAPGGSFSFTGGPFDTVRLLDTSGTPPNGGTTGGWDIAAVRVSPVPIPAAAWLFGSGLIGLAGIARRKKSA